MDYKMKYCLCLIYCNSVSCRKYGSCPARGLNGGCMRDRVEWVNATTKEQFVRAFKDYFTEMKLKGKGGSYIAHEIDVGVKVAWRWWDKEKNMAVRRFIFSCADRAVK